MAPLLVAAKFEALRVLLERIRVRTPPGVGALREDIDAQESLVLNLARAVQLCTDVAAHLVSGSDRPVPTTTRETFEALRDLGVLSPETAERLARASGCRNLAMHRYDGIDWHIVHAVATGSPDDFRDFAREVDAWLEREENMEKD